MPRADGPTGRPTRRLTGESHQACAPGAGTEQSPGLWYNPYPSAGGSSTGLGTTHRQHVVLGARHLTKANVLYADSHVDNDNQTPRDKRGSLVIASTFADYMDQYQMGTQHHLAPFGRHP